MMEIDEKAITYLEAHIPEIAEAAVKQAYWQALAAGNSVLVAEYGSLVEVFPNGEKRFVKSIEPRTSVNTDTIIKIR